MNKPTHKNWYSITQSSAANATDTPVYQVSIHDEIGAWGVSATDFLKAISGVPSNAKLEVSLHSPGGAVFDGLAIYNALKMHPGDVTITVQGLAASAASMILMAGKQRVMPTNSYIMLHNPSMGTWGEASAMLEAAELLQKIEQTSKRIYKEATSQDDAVVDGWLQPNSQTWFDGPQALELGLVHELTDAVSITQSLAQPAQRALGDAMPDLWQSALVDLQAKAKANGEGEGHSDAPADGGDGEGEGEGEGEGDGDGDGEGAHGDPTNTVPTNAAPTNAAPNAPEAIAAFAQACKAPQASAIAGVLMQHSVSVEAARQIFEAVSNSTDVTVRPGFSNAGETTPVAGYQTPTGATPGGSGGGRHKGLDLNAIYQRRRNDNR